MKQKPLIRFDWKVGSGEEDPLPIRLLIRCNLNRILPAMYSQTNERTLLQKYRHTRGQNQLMLYTYIYIYI